MVSFLLICGVLLLSKAVLAQESTVISFDTNCHGPSETLEAGNEIILQSHFQYDGVLTYNGTIQKCKRRVEVGPSCAGVQLDCTQDEFAVRGGYMCMGADRLEVKTSSQDIFLFCSPDQKPEVELLSGDFFDFTFFTDPIRNDVGFRCRMSCQGEPVPPPEPCEDECGMSSLLNDASETNQVTRIVGGENAKTAEFPWQVGIAFDRGSRVRSPFFSICGGSIISRDYVLTAAHCFDRTDGVIITPDRVTLLLGTVNRDAPIFARTTRRVTRIIIHPLFNLRTFEYDVALLRLDRSLDLRGPNIGPVCLSRTRPPTGTQSLVSGWGTTDFEELMLPFVLQKAEVSTVTQQSCAERYLPGRVTDRTICAIGIGQDACTGDSGGPLVYQNGGRFEQYGVVSIGFECAAPDLPGIYASVPDLFPWISDNIGGVANLCPDAR